MADQAVVEKTVHRLSETEVQALRDHAAAMVLQFAAERMPCFGGERDERTDLAVFDELTERMMAAAEVFAPLKAAGLAFSTAKGLPEPSECVVVAFIDRAMEWLRYEREDIRKMLAEQRRTIEVAEYEDGSGTSRDTFLLWVLDGIFEGLADSRSTTSPAADSFSSDPEIEQMEREAIKEIADAARRCVNTLPIKSDWRDFYISLSGLDAVDRIAALDKRLAGDDEEGAEV